MGEHNIPFVTPAVAIRRIIVCSPVVDELFGVKTVESDGRVVESFSCSLALKF